MKIFQHRKTVLVEMLSERAGEDSLQDRYNCGSLAAVNDILNIDVEEVSIDD